MKKDKKGYFSMKLPDFRMIRPLAFLERGGNKITQVLQESSLSINGCKVSFITPNSITLFYNKSRKEHDQALMTYNDVIRRNISGKESYEITLEELPKLFDYLEHIQASIITIFSAVEALCNVAIPEDYILTRKSSKGITESLDKIAIEKWIPTEEKVGKIVPEILQIESPKTLPLWPLFKELKDIRDNIIHQKQSVINPDEIESSFLNSLLDESIFKKINSGFELIQFFCAKDEMHTYFPLFADEVPVRVNIVDNFSETYRLALELVEREKDINDKSKFE